MAGVVGIVQSCGEEQSTEQQSAEELEETQRVPVLANCWEVAPKSSSGWGKTGPGEWGTDRGACAEGRKTGKAICQAGVFGVLLHPLWRSPKKDKPRKGITVKAVRNPAGQGGFMGTLKRKGPTNRTSIQHLAALLAAMICEKNRLTKGRGRKRARDGTRRIQHAWNITGVVRTRCRGWRSPVKIPRISTPIVIRRCHVLTSVFFLYIHLFHQGIADK